MKLKSERRLFHLGIWVNDMMASYIVPRNCLQSIMAVRHDCSDGLCSSKKSRKRNASVIRERHYLLQGVVSLLVVVVIFWIRPSHGHVKDDSVGSPPKETPFSRDWSTTVLQRQMQENQQRKINDSDADLQQKHEQPEKHTEDDATRLDTDEEELEVVIKLSRNPPPPLPVVEMMSHPLRAKENEQNKVVHMDSFTNLSTQLGALSNQIKVHDVVPAMGLFKATIPKSMLTQLQNDAHVAYAEPNDLVFFPHNRQLKEKPKRAQPSQRETTPRGIKMAIGYNDGYDDPRRLDTSTTYNPDPCSIKVGIIDSGIDIGHYDFINWCGVYDANGMPNPDKQQRCWGKAFLSETDLAYGQDWYNSMDFHGTHVAGVIAASGRNGAGLRGMVDDGNICLIIARVFGGISGGASLFQISEAIAWVVDQGANVINMSVGSPTSFQTLIDSVDYAEQQGALFVASAGNGAELDPPYMFNYPSDYPNVLSVAAVNAEDKIRGNFSNFNEYVDISAPGVEILSTIPRSGNEPIGVITSNEYDGAAVNVTMINVTGIKIEYSRYINHPGASGVLIDCGFGLEVCPGPVGGATRHVCFIQRGEIPFIDKARNCERSNAVAAIVVNNIDDIFRGTLGFNNVTGKPNTVRIPIIGVTTVDGKTLSSAMGGKVNFYYPLEGGAFGYQNGTSMAAPHVTGAAALIWRQCARCTRVDVLECLLSTAEDLGEPGRDDFYGHGLVQTDKALCCLQQKECCLQPTGAPTSTPYPSPIPTISPAPTRTISPSSTPSSLPSSRPSSSASPSTLPSVFPTNAPSITSLPSGIPSAFPSNVPSATLQPSRSSSPTSEPSVSPKPSQSQFPSWQLRMPSERPSSSLIE